MGLVMLRMMPCRACLSEAPNRATIERRLHAWQVETGLVISGKLDDFRKELKAARLCSELVFAVSKSLQHLSCSFH